MPKLRKLEMQKIVLDTNVIVSALLSKGIPSQIITELVLPKRVLVCLSESVLSEYIEVLNRDKFSKYVNFKTQAEIVIARIQEIAVMYIPQITVNLLSDSSDNKFLELAIAANADYVVTGNTRHFTISEIENTKIMTPTQYWELNEEI